MKSVFALLPALVIAACQPTGNGAPDTSTKALKATSVAGRIVLDTSTPDRALKSYWASKDAFRRAQFEVEQQLEKKLTEVSTEIGFDPAGIMTGDALTAARTAVSASFPPFDEYERVIVDVKQDTESRATAIVKINNATPIPVGKSISETERKARDAGEKFKYVLEKDSGGWRVAQAYKHDDFHAKYVDAQGDPWRPMFAKFNFDVSVRTSVYESHN